ncbi:MAG TPA: hypothetical protein VF785_25145 [Gemmatimonadaceae bacterium]
MIRRALVLTTIGVALSAAGALAFAPGFSRVSRVWSHGIMWSGHGFTPVPASLHSGSSGDDLLLQNEAVPGTYCPIPPRNSTPSTASTDSPVSIDTSLASSGASLAPQAKTGSLLTQPAATCVVPPAATPAPRPILP